MNKSELIEKLAQTEGFTTKVAKIVVETTLDSMTQALTDGNRIEIRRFSSFSVREYGGYTGHNPKNGEVIEVVPKKLPFFKPLY